MKENSWNGSYVIMEGNRTGDEEEDTDPGI